MKTRLLIGIQQRHELQIAQNVITGSLTISLDGRYLQTISDRKKVSIQVTIGQEEKHCVEIRKSAGFGRWEIAVDGVSLPQDSYARKEGTIMSMRLALLVPAAVGLAMLGIWLATSNGRFDKSDWLFVTGIFNLVVFLSLFAVTCAKNRMFSFASLLIGGVLLLGSGVELIISGHVSVMAWMNVIVGIALFRGSWAAWQNRHANPPSYEQDKDGKWKYDLPPNIAQIEADRIEQQLKRQAMDLSTKNEQPLSEHERLLEVARDFDRRKAINRPKPNEPAA